MKAYFKLYFITFLFILFIATSSINAQKKGLNEIKLVNLKSTVEFLASDEMKGRKTGEAENNIAALYLASEAAKIGLKPLNDNGSYLQPYQLTRTSLIRDSCRISLDQAGIKTMLSAQSIIVTPLPNSELSIEGQVIFGGYGIYSPEDDYYDLKNIDVKDKILMIMDRAPTLPDGKTALLKDKKWMKSANMDAKLSNLLSLRPKTIIFVLDPKSGHNSIEEIIPDATEFMSEQFSISGIQNLADIFRNSIPRIIIIPQAMADSILRPAGVNLKALQAKIDSTMKPQSMEIPLTTLRLHIQVIKEQIKAYNVAGLIEGSNINDKKDAIIYTAHFDHIGLDSKGIPNNGADDNASGTAALIEIAKAFKSEQKNIKRSIIILWVSGEELGLMGSKYYTEKPLFPLGNTLADINLDMIGRSWTSEDTGIVKGEQLDVKKGDSVYAAGGKDCSEILRLNENAAKQLNMQIDYAYNSPNDTKGMYYRSDHYNFAQKKIPVIFYTTGIHKDYHSPGDIPAKLDYIKMEKVTKLAFLLGYEIATTKNRLANDKY